EVRHPIYQFPGAEICLLNLNEVDCKSCLETSLFYGIAHICKLIEKIYMEFKYDNIGLAKLIITQKRIKYK
ncbi:3225_t:CDS:1, partial [Rhizophagus irregularis]